MTKSSPDEPRTADRVTCADVSWMQAVPEVEAQGVEPQPAAIIVKPDADAEIAAAAAAAQQALAESQASAESAVQATQGQITEALPVEDQPAQDESLATSLPGGDQLPEDSTAAALTQQAEGGILPIEDFTAKTRQVGVALLLACVSQYANTQCRYPIPVSDVKAVPVRKITHKKTRCCLRCLVSSLHAASVVM